MSRQMETKYAGGRIIETKSEDRNGVPVGILAGYIATWDVDTGIGARFGVPDQFIKGSFINSIADHKRRNMRQVRLKDLHSRVIGGFPIDTVREDGTGLYGRGEVNLDTQLGQEAYALAKQGVLVDFSVGFTSIDDKIEQTKRTIFEAVLWEGSLVDEPMNQNALVLEVKGVTRFADLNVAPADYVWDEVKAAERVGNLRFHDGDGNAAYLCEGKSLLFADVIEGRLVAVPQALQNIVNEMKEANRGEGQELDPSMVQHIERYYLKMNKPTPFDTKHFFGVDEVKTWTVREFEKALIDTGAFSKGAAKLLCTSFEEKSLEPVSDGLSSLLADIRGIASALSRS